jgi:hypothetical protein
LIDHLLGSGTRPEPGPGSQLARAIRNTLSPPPVRCDFGFRLLKVRRNVEETVLLRIIHSSKVIKKHRSLGIPLYVLKRMLERPGASKSALAAMWKQLRAGRRR